MALNNVMHMNVGDGESSYANNSGYQKSVMSKSFPFLDEILEDVFREHIDIPKCFKMVDLGCASGPNTFLAMSYIMDKIEDLCKKNNINNLPEFEVFLNDLPGNDFNNLFNLLPNYENGNRKENCSIYGLPGSFYGKLLPRKSIHFAYSSYSTQWLSQIPEGLDHRNKENVYMAMISPPQVHKAYANQYRRDFFTFLNSRPKEIISGGRMILTLLSRSVEDPSTKDDLETFVLFSETILDMVAEGLVDLEALYSFNLPMYAPCIQEVEAAIEHEGSFHLDKMHSFRVRWDAVENTDADHKSLLNFDKHRSGKFVANCFRAFMEPMLVRHFGSSIIDDLFQKFAKKVAEHLCTEKPAHYFNTVVSLSRK